MAIFGLPRHVGGAEIAACTLPVFNDDRVTDGGGQALRQRTPDHIIRTARRLGHDDGDDFGRVGICRAGRSIPKKRRGQRGCSGDDVSSSCHCFVSCVS